MEKEAKKKKVLAKKHKRRKKVLKGTRVNPLRNAPSSILSVLILLFTFTDNYRCRWNNNRLTLQP